MNNSFYDEDLVFIDLKAGSNLDAIKIIAEKLAEKNYVKENFVEKIIEREIDYPTGLELGNINVAIPHTEHEYVNEDKIAVAILKDPVLFRKMDDPDIETKVSIIFMLTIADSNTHLELLNSIFTFIQNQELIEKINNAKDKHEIISILEQQIN